MCHIDPGLNGVFTGNRLLGIHAKSLLGFFMLLSLGFYVIAHACHWRTLQLSTGQIVYDRRLVVSSNPVRG